jgi:predicted DCC family thiol-disulfide oxidoreductase YuxK
VFYDGACRMCAGVAAWAIARDRHRALDLVPYQSEEARARLGADGAARAAEELHVWSEARGIERGADAVAAMLRRLPGWEWAGRLIGAPPLAWLARPAYRAVARRRRRFGAAACDLPAPGAGSGRGRGRRGARAR